MLASYELQQVGTLDTWRRLTSPPACAISKVGPLQGQVEPVVPVDQGEEDTLGEEPADPEAAGDVGADAVAQARAAVLSLIHI